MTETLSIGTIVTNGFQRGLKNALPIAVNALLWSLTWWIPYLNVGTTIGLTVGLVAKSARDEPISYTEIFNPQYRKYMGDYFLTLGLVQMGVFMATLLLIIPGIVLGIAWSLALLLSVDKGLNPMDAIHKSNELTYGRKWVIFLGLIILEILVALAIGIIGGIFSAISTFLGSLVSLVLAAIGAAVIISALGHIYSSLTADLGTAA